MNTVSITVLIVPKTKGMSLDNSTNIRYLLWNRGIIAKFSNLWRFTAIISVKLSRQNSGYLMKGGERNEQVRSGGTFGSRTCRLCVARPCRRRGGQADPRAQSGRYPVEATVGRCTRASCRWKLRLGSPTLSVHAVALATGSNDPGNRIRLEEQGAILVKNLPEKFNSRILSIDVYRC